MKRLLNNKGFSLIELLVVSGIMIIVIMIAGTAFDKIILESSKMKKVSETNIEGIIGLEVLRRDLESTGYGLPWSFMTPITYEEFDTAILAGFPVQGIDARSFNDSPSAEPRAILSTASTAANKIIDGTTGVRLTNPGSDYLVIKSLNVAFGDVNKKWSYVNYSSNGATNTSFIKPWSSASEQFTANDSLITLRSTFSDSPVSRELVMLSGTQFTYKYNGSSPANDIYKPSTKTLQNGQTVTNDMFAVYGVNNLGSTDDIRMPFNRADYYVYRPASMPSYCNKGTGVLYKGVISNSKTSASSGGFLQQYPLLDCVGDMQVVYELDTTGSGNISYLDTLAGLDANQIRTQLKSIRVYILAHEGRKDTNYTYTYTDSNRVIIVGEPTLSSMGRVMTLANMVSFYGADWMNYRWKVYTLSVKPKNLN
jgi:Tfp pilus assembly protein PilW